MWNKSGEIGHFPSLSLHKIRSFLPWQSCTKKCLPFVLFPLFSVLLALCTISLFSLLHEKILSLALSPRVALLWSEWISHWDKWLELQISWPGSKFQLLPLDSIGTDVCKAQSPASSFKRYTVCSFKLVFQEGQPYLTRAWGIAVPFVCLLLMLYLFFTEEYFRECNEKSEL